MIFFILVLDLPAALSVLGPVSNCVWGSSSIIRHRHTERKIIEKSGEECNLRIFQSNSGLEKAIWKQSNVVLCYHVLSSFYRSYFTGSSLTYYVVAAALMDLHLCSFRQNYMYTQSLAHAFFRPGKNPNELNSQHF